MTAVRPPAYAGVLPFSIFPNDNPIQVFCPAMFQRGFDAGQNARRPYIGVLIEALADFQPQSPKGDVVGNIRVTGGAEENGVFAAEGNESIFGHHLAVLAVVVSTPVEAFALES